MKPNPRLSDEEWADLQLRISICPHQPSWPTEGAHWRRLHEVAHDARERVHKAYAAMDEIDSNADRSREDNADRSREDKERQRRKAAAQAVAEFEASKTLARAREAVRYFIDQWKREEQHISSDMAEATQKALKEAEAGWKRRWIRSRSVLAGLKVRIRCGARSLATAHFNFDLSRSDALPSFCASTH
jgi:hypothetical protein